MLMLMLLLLFLPQQPHYIAGFGNPGEIDLGPDIGLARPLARRRRGLGGKMFANLFRFIVLNGA
jgi:hypothetical protein